MVCYLYGGARKTPLGYLLPPSPMIRLPNRSYHYGDALSGMAGDGDAVASS